MRLFLKSWLTTSFGVFLAGFVPGIHFESLFSLLLAALLLGMMNALFRPLILLLSLPLIVFTLGFFVLVVNALMLRFVSVFVPGFHVDSFWSAFFGGLVISLSGWVVNSLGKESSPIAFSEEASPNQRGQMKQAKGRVIDGD